MTTEQKRVPDSSAPPAQNSLDAAADHARRYRHVAPKHRRPRLGKTAVRRAQSALAALSNAAREDRRTVEYRAAAAWEAEYVSALRDPSPQQLTLCRMAARTRLLLELTDAYLAQLGSPVNHGKRALFPVVVQRQSLASALLAQLQALGLERQPKRAATLRELLEAEADNSAPVDTPATKGAKP